MVAPTKTFYQSFSSLSYLCFLGFWVFICIKNKPYVHKIHLLMGALLVIVMVDLICGPADKQYVKITSNANGSDVLIYTFKFFRLVLFYTVIVLTGSGWSFLRPYLPIKEAIILPIVVPLNVAFVVIREPKLYKHYPFECMWVEFICWVPLVIPVLRTNAWLKKVAKAEGNAALTSAKDILFKFFIAIMLYSPCWTIAVFIVNGSPDCYCKWMSNAAWNATNEIFSLVFCMVMFYIFRPLNNYVGFDVEGEEVRQSAEGENSQTDPVPVQKPKNDVNGAKKPRPGLVFYPKLPEDFEW